MSLNIEFPSEQSLKLLAPDKGTHSIIKPMRFVRDGIKANYQDKRLSTVRRTRFVPAGQSTQMIVGASPESDYHILNLSANLYKKLEMQRVFFSAYIPVNDNPLLPPAGQVQLLREHRLYQADWLMRFYEFDVREIIDEEHPFLDPNIDPKCNWALNHLDQFPVEVNRVPYEMLLRIPGVGVRGAKRIMMARRERRLRFEDLKRLNIVMKRAKHFITCNGSYATDVVFDPSVIYRQLSEESQARRRKGVLAGQMSLFDAATHSGLTRQPVAARPAAALPTSALPTLQSAAAALPAAAAALPAAALPALQPAAAALPAAAAALPAALPAAAHHALALR
jgi:predicted DNA-binding helix-hairpin-helix protein